MPENKTLSMAILSGKGGVGKSNLALNLAYALNAKKAKVLLMDCDLGLANLDVLLGIAPQNNILNLQDASLNAEDVLINIQPGLDLLPASSGIVESLEAQNEMPDILAEKLENLAREYDYIILDIGAGISSAVLSFAAMALMRIMVITPEPTSLTDSYALIKVLASRQGVRDHMVLVNQSESLKQEEQAFKRLQSACSHFLNISPLSLGGVRSDNKLMEAVRRQKPMILEFPESNASKDFLTLADKIAKLRKTMLPKIAGMDPLRNLRERPAKVQ